MLKRCIPAFVALFVLASCSCGHFSTQTRIVPKLVNAYKSNVLVLIVADTGDGKGAGIKGSGSGTLLRGDKGKPGIILSAAHVFKALPPKWTGGRIAALCDTPNSEDCSMYELKILRIDVRADLVIAATIRPLEKQYTHVTVATEEPMIGSEVFVAGNPEGEPYILTRGIVSRILKQDGFTYIGMDAGIMPGSSGSGVFNTHGELVGIVQQGAFLAGIIPIPGGGIALGLKDLKIFLAGGFGEVSTYDKPGSA